MRIVVYAINYSPELTGCGKYTGEMVSWLAAHGCSVDVVTTPPYYPEWTVKPGYGKWSYRTESDLEQSEAVRITRCPLYVPKKVTGKTRLLHLMSFALSSVPPLFRALWARPDMLVLVLPTLVCAPVALVLCRLFRVKAWVHVQDYEVDAAFGLGVIKGGLIRKVATALESSMLRAFDMVSSITPRMVDRAASKGIRKEKIRLFPNWVDLSSIYPLEGPNSFRTELGLGDEDILLLYSGNMGEKQGIEIIIDAARLLESVPHIHFVLVGSGAAKGRLMSLSVGLSNIHWLPLQPIEMLNTMLNAADIHMLPQRADAADLVMPSKLTGMLASARAVVGTAAAGTQLGDVLHEVGVRVDPEDTDAFVAAIRRLATDVTLRSELGRRGRLYSELNLDQDVIMKKFLLDAQLCCGMTQEISASV